MMLPYLDEVAKSRDYQIEFEGLNRNLYVGENQFADTMNLCATHYPVMAPRAARAKVRHFVNLQDLYAKNRLCWVDDGYFYWDGVQYGGRLTDGKKQMVGMGAYVLIFPDGMRFNTHTKEWDALGSAWTAEGAVKASMCRLDGSDYDNVTVSETAPEGLANGAFWLDTSGDKDVLKLLSGGAWVSVPTVYVRIEAAGIGTAFREGDAVNIEGIEGVNGSYSILGRTEDSITITEVLRRNVTQTGGLTVSRTIPQMDFVCELNNRIWGCSNAKHEIYACKLGDATNWFAFDGLASDSYAATVGSDGDFTGCCAFGGQVLFWKEDMLHKVMGTKPSNFQINDTPMQGVQAGSEKSICIVNSSLMYKGRESVCIYDGGTAMDISDALGPEMYEDAAAGVQGSRYYISMKGEDGKYSLFTFDEEKGLWYREDETQATAFAAHRGQLYYADEQGDLYAVRGTQEPEAELEGPFEWYAETGDLMMELPDNKYVSRIQIRAGVEKGSRLRVEARYDSEGEWITLLDRGYSRKASFTAPIIPMRCDHFRLRISGVGRSCVYALSKEIEAGSEL